jgi:hypothetical protein
MDKIKTRVQNDIGVGIERHIAAEKEREKKREPVEGHKSVLNRKKRSKRKIKNKTASKSRKRNR